MGDQSCIIIMKFFVVASAFVAAAMAEADPAVFYSGYGYPYAYGLHAFAGKSVPCAGAPLAYAGYPYAPVAYGKRSADAEPEADAAVVYAGYGYPYAYGYVPFGSSSGLDPITQGLDPATQGYVPYYGYGYHGYYGKRSADADAEADPALLYGAYGYPYGLGYNLGYAGYGYPYAYGAGIAATNAALGHAVAYTAAGVTHSSNVGVCTNYLGAVVPC